MGEWKGGLIEWEDGGAIHLSVIFTWKMNEAYQKAIWYKQMGYQVIAGGPAVRLMPNFLNGVAEIGTDYKDAVKKHNPNACFTTRGCVNKCSFCAVPRIEGDFKELKDIEFAPIVCDNNFLASSGDHFDWVIDNLKRFSEVDFNQGLDTRLLDRYKAERLAELDMKVVRLAWDNTNLEEQFMDAFHLLRDVGFPKDKIRVYVLIGFRDTPEDALYRLSTVKELGAWPFPMRYQPLGALYKNSYVAPAWTEYQLRRYQRYWSRLAWLEHIPFSEYKH